MLEIRTLAWLSAPPALLAVLVARVAAQTSSAVCMPAFGWMNNSKGQTPCLVAAYLASACDTPSVVDTVDALVPGNEYELPPGPIATVCRCNTVYYSAISACAACQNGSYVTWTTWKEACVSSIVDQFPKDIPQDTAVPAWAFLDVTTSNRFNLTAAEAFAAHAITESTLLLVPTLSFSMPGSPFSFTPASSTGHTGPQETNNKGIGNREPDNGDENSSVGPQETDNMGKKSNVGPIVGGVVGGIAGVATVLSVLLLLRRRHRRHLSSDVVRSRSLSSEGAEPLDHPEFDGYKVPARQVLYNPDDPSTFPGARPDDDVPSIIMESSLRGVPNRVVGYTGVAEL